MIKITSNKNTLIEALQSETVRIAMLSDSPFELEFTGSETYLLTIAGGVCEKINGVSDEVKLKYVNEILKNV